MSKFISTIEFGKCKSAEARVDFLAECLIDKNKYPFKKLDVEGLFECEGTRLLMHYCLLLTVVNPLALTVERMRRVIKALNFSLRFARATSVASFIQDNIEYRLSDFEAVEADGLFSYEDTNIPFAELVRRFNLLLVNFECEITREDTTSDFEFYGVRELMLMCDDCDQALWQVSEKVIQTPKLEINGGAKDFAKKFNEVHLPLSRFAECASSSSTKECLIGNAQENVAFLARARFVRVATEAFLIEQDSYNSEQVYANEAMGIASHIFSPFRILKFDSNTSPAVLDKQPTDKVIESLSSCASPNDLAVEESKMDKIVTRKNVTADRSLDELVEGPYHSSADNKSSDVEKADLWLQINYPDCHVIFSDEWEHEELIRTIRHSGASGADALELFWSMRDAGLDVEHVDIKLLTDSEVDAF